MTKMKIRIHEASPRKYRQHPSKRIGAVNDAEPFVARKHELDVRAREWKSHVEQGTCLHDPDFCKALSGMLHSEIAKIPRSDIEGVRFDMEPGDAAPTIWWGWVYVGSEYQVSPDKEVTLENGDGAFWAKAMGAMVDKIRKNLMVNEDLIINHISSRDTGESIEYGLSLREKGVSEILVQCKYPSIKESARIITDIVIPVWRKLVKAADIAEKEIAREYN